MEVKSNEAKLKRIVSTFSLAVSVLLVLIKILIAYYSNSIGVFSEALNNGLDIITVAITFFAVRAATKPADQDHTYGHGKYENLSALFEIIIIAFLCFFIIYKSIFRIFLRNFSLQLNIYIFIVLGVSIVINIVRVYFIGKVAKKYNSFAFKAEFINYLSDIISSLIVISGLFFAKLGFFIADPIASIIVSIIILAFSFRLFIKVIRNLLDYIPKEITNKINNIIGSFPEIKTINKIKVHEVGDIKFINIVFSVNDNIYLSQLENIKENIKKKILCEIPNSEIVLEAKPLLAEDNIDCIVKEIILNEPGVKDLHNIFIYKVNDEFDLSIHVEMNKTISLSESDELTSKIEDLIKEKNKKIRNVYIHIEDAKSHENHESWDDITSVSEDFINKIKKSISDYVSRDTCHKFTVLERGGNYNISFHCRLDKNINIEEAHSIVSLMEKRIKNLSNKISDVSIHVEPNKS